MKKIIKKAMRSASFFTLALMLFPEVGVAQTPSDAGSLRQQLERERGFSAPQRDLSIPEQGVITGPSDAGDVQIQIKTFHFEGNTLLSDEDLTAVLQGYLNRPLTFSELQSAAADVGEAYRKKGWVVRAFLPEQNIVEGIVTIQIVEARFGKTSVESDAETWLTQGEATRMVSAQQKSNETLNSRQLDRALLLMDDLPGVAAAGRLQGGDSAGQTDLVVKLAPEPFVSGFGAIDNEGARATGEARAHGSIQLASPFQIGDQTSLYALFSEGLKFARLGQSFPIGNDGLRIGANASILDYRVLPSEFDALDGEGNSASLGLEASYPILRARENNLYLDAAYDHRRFTNETTGINASHYSTDSLTAGLRGNLLDEIGGGGVNVANLSLTLGNLDLNALDSSEDTDLDGGYSKMTYGLSRQQTITPDLSFYAAVSGQISPDEKLDSSEMFYLGGPYGVRAYPVSEGSGVDGYLANAELRWQLDPQIQVKGFYDHGYVRNHDNIESYSLKGAGLGLDWQPGYGLNVKATWAHRIGDNPNPASDGDDQDGSDVKNRFWLGLSKQF